MDGKRVRFVRVKEGVANTMLEFLLILAHRSYMVLCALDTSLCHALR